MVVLAWNVRGLGNRETVRALWNSVSKHKPTIVFLSETKQKKRYLEKMKMKMKMKMESSFYVEPQGIAGGLALWWTNDAKIIILKNDKKFIDTKVILHEGEEWFETFIYGPPYREEKKAFWEEVSQLRRSNNVKWLVIGDSNIVTSQGDKEGGTPFNPAEASCFSNFFDSTGLLELPIKGGSFTWYNKRSGEHAIMEKLDCILCSTD